MLPQKTRPARECTSRAGLCAPLHKNFLRRKYQMHSATMTRLTKMMSGYPHGQASSGMPVKFMPYQPASSVSGRKTVSYTHLVRAFSTWNTSHLESR